MKRSGYTVRELIVFLIVMALLFSMGLPYFVWRREEARKLQCQNNLRTFGQGLALHADRDPLTRYCTGACDWYRDGCPDSVGWVADMVNMNFCRPIDVLCPVNPMRGNETLAELYSAAYTQTEPGNPQPILAMAGICGESAFGAPNTPARATAVEKNILDKGYCTNYTASWYLVRSGCKITISVNAKSGNGTVTDMQCYVDNLPNPQGELCAWKSLGSTCGPLKRIDVMVSEAASWQIPLLGDGAVSDSQLATLPVALKFHGAKCLDKGDSLAMSFNAGPATWNGQSLVPMPKGVLVLSETGLDTESPKDAGQASDEARGLPYGSVALQDTRGWYCHHARGGCNILFADGSVREYRDLDGDGLLNPGFDVGATAAAGRQRQRGSSGLHVYAGLREDLPRMEVFSGLFVRVFVVASGRHSRKGAL
jgi:prepilin-type processing-associated H-X9-DG protein